MKRRCCLILICLFSLLFSEITSANAEKINQEYTIDQECSFTVIEAKEYDVFFNQESGNAKQWLVVSVDILNWRNDYFYVKTETDAQIIYDEDFEFSPSYLWTSPVGSYHATGPNATLYIYEMDNTGKLYGNVTDLGGGYEKTSVNFGNYDRIYDPINNAFYYIPDGPTHAYAYQTIDASKTILAPLVERTYYYVFLVPDLVAEEEGAREFIFHIADEEYTFRF